MLGCARLGEAIVGESTLTEARASFAELLARGLVVEEPSAISR
jgi:hypothetical protein